MMVLALYVQEMNVYKKHEKANLLLDFIDISQLDFDFEREGLDKAKANKYLHVRLTDGRIVTGVDSFVAIWQALEVLPFFVFGKKQSY